MTLRTPTPGPRPDSSKEGDRHTKEGAGRSPHHHRQPGHRHAMETFPRCDTDSEPVGLAGLAFEMELDERSPPHCSILWCRTPSQALSSCDASDSGGEHGTEHDEDETACCSKPVRHCAWTTTRCMMRLRRARPDHPRPPARVRLGAVALRPRMMQSSCTRHRRHRQRVAAADRSPCICGWALASEHVTRRGEDARSVRSHTHPCFSIAAINRHCQNVSCCGVARSSESEASVPNSIA